MNSKKNTSNKASDSKINGINILLQSISQIKNSLKTFEIDMNKKIKEKSENNSNAKNMLTLILFLFVILLPIITISWFLIGGY